MVRRIACFLIALAAVAALALPCAAFAVNADGFVEISNRYEKLDDLQGTVDTSDSVVTTTRVGVLTSVNRTLDGTTVSFTGEVVGDIMSGGDGHKWLNVLGSDGSCVGVWVDDNMANRIMNVGSYSTTGTSLQVRGIYSIDCKDHQGELDVHALDIRVLDAGGEVTHYVNKKDIVWGLVLSGIGFILLMTFVALRVRSDRKNYAEANRVDD